jgi:hypothetical protein
MFYNSFLKQKSGIFWPFCSKKCAKVQSHIARPKMSRTHAHRTNFSKWISHGHAHMRPHITRVHARTHLRNSPFENGFQINKLKTPQINALYYISYHAINLEWIQLVVAEKKKSLWRDIALSKFVHHAYAASILFFFFIFFALETSVLSY